MHFLWEEKEVSHLDQGTRLIQDKLGIRCWAGLYQLDWTEVSTDDGLNRDTPAHNITLDLWTIILDSRQSIYCLKAANVCWVWESSNALYKCPQTFTDSKSRWIHLVITAIPYCAIYVFRGFLFIAYNDTRPKL